MKRITKNGRSETIYLTKADLVVINKFMKDGLNNIVKIYNYEDNNTEIYVNGEIKAILGKDYSAFYWTLSKEEAEEIHRNGENQQL